MDFDLDLAERAATTGFPAGSTGEFSMTQLLASQARNVELMAHLASYSELLVAVSGPQGAGKTALANALAAQREEPEDTLFLTASIMLGMPAVLSAIASHWDMPPVLDDGAQAREMIRNEALSRHQAGAALLVIIDQAEQLDSATLNDIAHFALLAPQAISFALFGESGFEQNFRNSPAQAPVHILQLEPLVADEAAALIGSVFGDAGICPLDDQEVDKAIAASGGWPGPLLLSAEKLLMAPRVGGQRKTTASGFPLRNILGIAVIATAMVMLLLYQLGSEQETVVKKVPVGPQEPVVSVPESAAPADFNYPAQSGSESADVPANEPETVSLAVNDVAVVTDGRVAAPVSVAEVATPAVKAPVTAATPAPVPVVRKTDAPKVEPVRQVAAKPASTVSSVSRTADESALLAARDGYIVQLLGSYSAGGAAGFRKEWAQKVTGTLYQYQTTHNGKDWFVVVSGIYGSRTEATAAVNALPAKLRAQSPWIRPVADAQKAIR